jgi:hypothetical protein
MGGTVWEQQNRVSVPGNQHVLTGLQAVEMTLPQRRRKTTNTNLCAVGKKQVCARHAVARKNTFTIIEII